MCWWLSLFTQTVLHGLRSVPQIGWQVFTNRKPNRGAKAENFSHNMHEFSSWIQKHICFILLVCDIFLGCHAGFFFFNHYLSFNLFDEKFHILLFIGKKQINGLSSCIKFIAKNHCCRKETMSQTWFMFCGKFMWIIMYYVLLYILPVL